MCLFIAFAVMDQADTFQALLDIITAFSGAPCTADDVAELLDQATTAWINALAGLSREAGHSRREAQVRATDAVVAIQGALVLARITGDRSAFERAITALPERLL